MHILINETPDSYEYYISNKQRIDRTCPYCKARDRSWITKSIDWELYKCYECPCMKNKMWEYIFWTPKKTITREEYENR